MSSPAALPRSAVVSGRAPAILVALAAALVPAVFFVPHLLAATGAEGGFADQRNLIRTVSAEFVGYWSSGHRDLTPGLANVVDYWFRFHIVKAALAAILLIVLIKLGALVWKAFLRADRPGAGTGTGRRVALASAGVLVTMLALLSLVVVMANVQGAVAPLTSLLTLLPIGTAHGRLAATLDQVRQRLADYPSTGHQASPALELMIGDNARYHLAVAVLATILAVVFIGVIVLLWRGYARTDPSDRRTRRVLRSYGVLSALSSMFMIVLAVANTTNTVDSAQGLMGFFSGGY